MSVPTLPGHHHSTPLPADNGASVPLFWMPFQPCLPSHLFSSFPLPPKQSRVPPLAPPAFRASPHPGIYTVQLYLAGYRPLSLSSCSLRVPRDTRKAFLHPGALHKAWLRLVLGGGAQRWRRHSPSLWPHQAPPLGGSIDFHQGPSASQGWSS